jgi:hypothetical protein
VSFFRSKSIARLALALVTVACGSEKTVAPKVLTTITVAAPVTSLQMGQTVTATAAGADQDGATFPTGAIVWSSSSEAVAKVDATTGVITAVTIGAAEITATAGAKSGKLAVSVVASPGIKINEVESNGGTPGDWVELFNPTSAAVDISGWGFRDNDASHVIYKIPANTSIPAGGYYVIEESAFGFGLGGADDATLYNPFGAVVEIYSWAVHAGLTYGRCANGTGAFINTAASTKAAANACGASVSLVWPGEDVVTTVDGLNIFQTNLSALTYEGAVGASPAVLWAGRNGPGTLFRLIFSGGIWTPDPASGWSAGKALRYTDGTGNPDTEGVTFAAGGSAGGMYIATERNNDASTISRNVILRVDPSVGTGTSLTATHQWDITANLPVVGANLGIEAITWVPDSYLTARGFVDESTGAAYVPANYPDHGTGVFFVGLEGGGSVFAYTLNHANGTFQRIATIVTGFMGVMGLEFDRELNNFWATCDDTCGGKHAILEISATAGATLGRFVVTRVFDKPASMPNLNNEGFAITPQSECASGRKPVYWADDGETSGHSIRRATITCSTFAGLREK